MDKYRLYLRKGIKCSGCYWCKFREGLKCTNKIKLRENGLGWDLTSSLKRGNRELVSESLKIPLLYGVLESYIGCRCPQFKRGKDKSKERVVFT